jgi:hypothetical protein
MNDAWAIENLGHSSYGLYEGAHQYNPLVAFKGTPVLEYPIF